MNLNLNPQSIVKWVSGIVADVHKEAALVIAFLASFGVTPGSASTHKWETAIFAGYAALGHLASGIAAKAVAPPVPPN